ncbi:MAG: flagellar basal body rod protein FlgC [Planctomycetes bacterium]|nr:flagellar basal body rod protein FlgC [Planctomycetota bacterium]
MDLNNVLRGLSISASGLLAERVRMGLIATNLAHAHDTNRGDGTPYKRQLAVFETVLDGEMRGGVRVAEIVDDTKTPHLEKYQPGHRHADSSGMVKMPNINPTFEMVDLMTAARAYEANLQAAQMSVRMAEQALELAR